VAELKNCLQALQRGSVVLYLFVKALALTGCHLHMMTICKTTKFGGAMIRACWRLLALAAR
jgi:hypothetical protein